MVSVYIHTQVEVELTEIDTTDLAEELKERKYVFTHLEEYEIKRLAERVENALAFNKKEDLALALREYFEQVHDIRFTDNF